jgi:hypothetical protein
MSIINRLQREREDKKERGRKKERERSSSNSPCLCRNLAPTFPPTYFHADFPPVSPFLPPSPPLTDLPIRTS